MHRSLLVLLLATAPLHADDWPQWLGPQRDGVWREKGIYSKFPEGGLKARWTTPIGEGYSGPAVANSRVYITDRVLAKDAKNPDSPFNAKQRVDGTERVLCLDEKTGSILWKKEYPAPYQISYASGPRTTPVVDGNQVYTLGAMGDLYCFDAAKGDILWSRNLTKEYTAKVPFWGFSAHPLIDGDRLICLVGGKGSAVVAFDKKTGNEKWKALTTGDASYEPGYAPPVLTTLEGKKTLIVWHPTSVNALNPETGDVYWSHTFTKGKQKTLKANLSIPTPRIDGNLLFLTAFYEGPLMLELHGLKTPTELWRGKGRSEQPDDTDGLHSIMSTPFLKDGHIYGVCSYGELRCLDAKTGRRIWQTHQATTGKSMRWGHAFLVENEGRFLIFNELGDVILANLSPKGYEEISRANLLRPTNTMAAPAGRRVIWSHPAYADGCIFARNDESIVCVPLK